MPNRIQPSSNGSNNCINCSQQQLWNQQPMPGEPHWQARHLNGSNMSLNLPPPSAYYPSQQYDMQTAWMHNAGYRYPYPMPVQPLPNGEQSIPCTVLNLKNKKRIFRSSSSPSVSIATTFTRNIASIEYKVPEIDNICSSRSSPQLRRTAKIDG